MPLFRPKISPRLPLCAAAMLLSLTSVAGVDHNTGQKETQVEWKIDLSKWSRAYPVQIGQRRVMGSLPTSLCFTDNSIVAAGFITREGAVKLIRRRGSMADSPIDLQAVFVDARTGKIENTPMWPTNATVSDITPAAIPGDFVVQTGDVVTLYNSQFKQVSRVRLPSSRRPLWTPYPSPSARSILFVQWEDGRGRWVWLETERLRTVHTWQYTRQWQAAIADDKVALSGCPASIIASCRVTIKPLEGGTVSLAAGWSPPWPEFINSHLLFLWDQKQPWLVSVVSAENGATVFSEDGQSAHEFFDFAAVSVSGTRFVVPVYTSMQEAAGTNSGPRPELVRLLVFDLPSLKPSFTVALKGIPVENQQALFALSPDGRRLAFLSYEKLQIIRLPFPP